MSFQSTCLSRFRVILLQILTLTILIVLLCRLARCYSSRTPDQRHLIIIAKMLKQLYSKLNLQCIPEHLHRQLLTHKSYRRQHNEKFKALGEYSLSLFSLDHECHNPIQVGLDLKLDSMVLYKSNCLKTRMSIPAVKDAVLALLGASYHYQVS